MAEFSNIEWTDHTFNPWIGCQKISPGCDNCYAETMMDHRFHRVEWGPHGSRLRTSPANWRAPFRWAAEAARRGRSARVFCASLADVFDNKVDAVWRVDLFDLIRMTTELDWLVLTKRPENFKRMLPPDWGQGYENVWLGTTAENQKYYDHRWPILKATPAKLRFVSYEPALGPLEIAAGPSGEYPDWIICGGESGAGARYMKRRWARDLRDECRQRGVSFFMKQMTNKVPIPPKLFVRQFPDGRRRLAA
jgi:protein gp37